METPRKQPVTEVSGSFELEGNQKWLDEYMRLLGFEFVGGGNILPATQGAPVVREFIFALPGVPSEAVLVALRHLFEEVTFPFMYWGISTNWDIGQFED